MWGVADNVWALYIAVCLYIALALNARTSFDGSHRATEKGSWRAGENLDFIFDITSSPQGISGLNACRYAEEWPALEKKCWIA